MSFLKFHPQQLFTGSRLLEDDHVLITDQAGTVQSIVPLTEAGDDIQHVDGLLTPGFINCHCHLELSHMKGLIPEKTGLVDFVFQVVTQRHFTREDILAAISDAEEEMIRQGIVATGDICNNTLTLHQKEQHRMAYYNFTEVSGWLPGIAQDRFGGALTTDNSFSAIGHPHGISPHAPYSVSDPLWQLLKPAFAGKTVTIHNQETPYEDELFISGSGDFVRMYEMMRLDTSFFRPPGKSSLQSCFDKLASAAQVLLVHNTFTGEQDIVFAANTGIPVHWCLCVNANLYIENAVPPVALLRKHGCNIVLGTDSLASNHTLSILDEMRTLHLHFPGIPLEELLRWSSYNGAAALQMPGLGSFEKGKTPGINLLNGIRDNRITAATTVTRLI